MNDSEVISGQFLPNPSRPFGIVASILEGAAFSIDQRETTEILCVFLLRALHSQAAN